MRSILLTIALGLALAPTVTAATAQTQAVTIAAAKRVVVYGAGVRISGVVSNQQADAVVTVSIRRFGQQLDDRRERGVELRLRADRPVRAAGAIGPGGVAGRDRPRETAADVDPAPWSALRPSRRRSHVSRAPRLAATAYEARTLAVTAQDRARRSTASRSGDAARGRLADTSLAPATSGRPRLRAYGQSCPCSAPLAERGCKRNEGDRQQERHRRVGERLPELGEALG